MGDLLCVVCHRREPARGFVCDADRQWITARLTELPGRLALLDTQLVPASTGGQYRERVTAASIIAPMPVRAAVLSMQGPGSEDTQWRPSSAILHPAVRHWVSEEQVTVVTGPGTTRTTTVRVWHRELERDQHGYQVYTADDDQIGILPPREWLDMWTRRWRRHLGHHVPARTYPVRQPAPPDQAASPHGGGLRALIAAALHHPQLIPAAAAAAAVHQQRLGAARTILGLHDYIAPAQRPDDPLADEWEIRFGEPPRYQAVVADLRYLLTWLNHACDEQDLDVGAFAAELRSLHAEIGRILGDIPDQQWLGRCPTMLVDNATGQHRPCGAGLWQDPHASQVQCPRCHSTWGPDMLQILDLARDIRTVWPIDRRLRYTSRDRDGLTPLTCPACDEKLTVTWREVTAHTDRERWWRPTGATCPNACPDARRAL